MFEIDSQNIKQYESDLKRFAARAYPFAVRNTLNGAAFAAKKLARENLREGMVLRNRFTEQSVLVHQERGLNVNRMEAIVGSTAAYLETQEFGGTKTKRGKSGTPIATSTASGEARGATPRRKLPNQLQSIRLKRQRKIGASKIQENFIAVRQAAASGQKFVFLRLRRSEGIFRVVGGKRKPRIRMLWDLSRKSVDIPRNPWLFPATQDARKQIPRLYEASLKFQLRRAGILGK